MGRMTSRSSVPRRRTALIVPALVVALLAAAGLLLCGSARGGGGLLAVVPGVSSSPGADESGRVDGFLSVDADHAALRRLDPELLAAVRAAARGAAEDDVDLRVSSGWRSRGYQQDLLDRAVETYGSRREARRWVETPDGSAHTRGDAVDVGPTDAAYWLAQHGAAYGLCQTYANEIWHFELRAAQDDRCPAPRADGRS